MAKVTSGSFCAGNHKDLTAAGNRASPWHLVYLNGFVTEQFFSFFPRSFFRARSIVALPSPLNFFALLFCLFFFFRAVLVCFCFRCARCRRRRRRLCFRLSIYYNIMSAHNCFIAEISIQERPDPAEVMYQIKGVKLPCLSKSE